MIAVAFYLVATAPFLPLMLLIHRLGGAYTGLFVVALVLQLVPIGLVYLPLGFIGVVLLGYSLKRTADRLRDFRRSGVHHPEVHARWVKEYLLNLLAFGFALEQKIAAALFIDTSTGAGLTHLLPIALPCSLLLWAGLAFPIHREWRALRGIVPAETN